MKRRSGFLVSVSFILLGVVPDLVAGGIYIRYGPDAPEKLAVADEEFYKGALKLDHRRPAEFAHNHHFYAKLFNDPTLMDDLVARWEAHEQRFEYWSFPLWKVLDGYVVSRNVRTPPPPILPPPSGTSGTGSQGNGGTGNGGVGTQSVPEPSTLVLFISGLMVGLGRLAWRRALGRDVPRSTARLGLKRNPPMSRVRNGRMTSWAWGPSMMTLSDRPT